MQAPTACAPPTWRSFGRLSGLRPSAWIWVWSWGSSEVCATPTLHHLSPARAIHPAGPDPEAGLSRPKSPQQRSVQARKPVVSEQDRCSFSSIALTPNPWRCGAAIEQRCGGPRRHTPNSLAILAAGLRLYRAAIVACFVLWREFSSCGFWDFCNTIGTNLTWSVKLTMSVVDGCTDLAQTRSTVR